MQRNAFVFKDLSYGNRIMQFPQGVFAISLATALLPTLSRQTASGKLQDAGKTLGRATLALAALMIPATFCLLFLAEPVVHVILARGAFTAESTALTSTALVFYSVGLLFYGAVKITAPVFYAMKDTKTPVKIAMSCMGLNIILNIVLTQAFIRTGIARPLAGLALATRISSMLNFMILRIALRRKLGPVVQSSKLAWLSMIPAGILTLLFLWLLSPSVISISATSTLKGILSISGTCLGAVAIFLAVFVILGGKDARSVFSLAVVTQRHHDPVPLSHV